MKTNLFWYVYILLVPPVIFLVPGVVIAENSCIRLWK